MKKIVLFSIAIAATGAAFAQNGNVGIGTTTPNADAKLDITATNKGLLLPRIALTGTANAAPLSAHVAGMTVYNTKDTLDVTKGAYFNDGTKWVRVGNGNASNAWALGGNAGTDNATQFVGTRDSMFLSVGANGRPMMHFDYRNSTVKVTDSIFSTTGRLGGTMLPLFGTPVPGYNDAALTATTTFSAATDIRSPFAINRSRYGIAGGTALNMTENGDKVAIGVSGSADILIANGVTNTGYVATQYGWSMRARPNDFGTLERLSGNVVQIGHHDGGGMTGGLSNTAVTNQVVGYEPSVYALRGNIGTIALYSGNVTGSNYTNLYGLYLLDGRFKHILGGRLSVGTTDTTKGGFLINYDTAIAPAANKNGRSIIALSTSKYQPFGNGPRYINLFTSSPNIDGHGIGVSNGMTEFYTNHSMAFFVRPNRNTIADTFVSNEVMRINQFGNVGIGTTDPIQKLHIMNGNLRIDGVDNDFNGIIQAGYSTPGALQHAFLMGLGSNGPKSSPAYPVVGQPLYGIFGRDIIDYNSPTNHYGGASMFFRAAQNFTAANKGTQIEWQTTANNTNVPLTKMVLSEAGNLSIGNLTPQAKLDVTGYIKVGSSDPTVDNAATVPFGTIRYNSTTGRGEMYVNDANGDGTQGDAGWRAF